LKLKLSPTEERAIGKRATRNVEAYEEYLRGRACLREMTRRSVELSGLMFARAVVLDPSYAAAYAGLSDSASMLAFHYDDAIDGLSYAIVNSRRALELDPDLAEAYAARGRARSILNEIGPAEEDFGRRSRSTRAFTRRISIWRSCIFRSAALPIRLRRCGRPSASPIRTCRPA
jgi:adenylate cyclase